MRATGHVALAKRWLLRWGLVLFSLAVAGGVAALPIQSSWVVSVFALVAAGWGYFVRSMQGRIQLHEKVDAIGDGMADVLAAVRSQQDDEADEPQAPRLHVVRD